MRTIRAILVVLCIAGTLGGFLGLVGCEDSPTDVGINIRLEHPADSQPEPSALVVRTGESIVLVAEPASTNRDLFLPLAWSVSDASLGTITASGGFTAAYTASRRAGSNVISVEDQAGAQGVSVINQREEE